MNLAMLLEMAGEGGDDRVAVGPEAGGLTYAQLLDRARRAAAWFGTRPTGNVGLVGVNSEAVPVVLFGAAISGRPFAPLNYRWSDEQLRRAAARLAPAVLVVDRPVVERVSGIDGVDVIEREELLQAIEGVEPALEPGPDTDAPAVLLFTSGTSGEPKVAVLRHDNLTSYILGTVEFLGAAPDEATLVSVPPYHVAGIAGLLSSVYGGRRIVQLAAFDPGDWVELADAESVTHAMVVPTMLARILDVLAGRPEVKLPCLRHLSYGGGRMALPVIEAAVLRLPDVGFVNAYGLTETSSTVAVLGPDDHRQAIASEDPAVRRRLGSVGQPLPTIEVEIRSPDGDALPPGEPGEIWVRGEQVSGEYLGLGSVRDGSGWFPTKDGGWMDDAGYLYVEGRLDDVIVRGGENISPGEVEDALLAHPCVSDCAVIGIPDDDWGEVVAAVVVPAAGTHPDPAELQDWVRSRLRSSKTPSRIDLRPELPYNDNGKLLRRQLRAELRMGG
jgi:acyl-CoA synthetase (AMP-forming)/AMP-acid ligase II